MSQLILSEVEHRHPQCALVAVEEEPRVLHWVQVSHNVQFSGWRVALGTHDGNLVAFPCHVNHYQCDPFPLSSLRDRQAHRQAAPHL